MSEVVLPEQQVRRGVRGKPIVLVVMDGLGGLPHPLTGLTELESAHAPHMDALAARSSLGMTVMVREGITPGSGPGHLSLFGYDPTRYVIGRGVLSALGVGVELDVGDVAARLNLALMALAVHGDGYFYAVHRINPLSRTGRGPHSTPA